MRVEASSSFLRGAMWALMLPMSLLLLMEHARAQEASTQPGPLAPGLARLVELDGSVEFQRKGGEFEFRTPTVSAVVRGTEFSLQVGDDR